MTPSISTRQSRQEPNAARESVAHNRGIGTPANPAAAEIEVAKLIGATNTYIQRPLHYFGMLQGALGGLCAALLVSTGSHLLTPPVAELALLYGGTFTLQGLSPNDIAALAAIGGSLGWLGAKISALIHLRRIS